MASHILCLRMHYGRPTVCQTPPPPFPACRVASDNDLSAARQYHTNYMPARNLLIIYRQHFKLFMESVSIHCFVIVV